MAPADRNVPDPDPVDRPAEREFPVDAGTRPARAQHVREYPLGESEVILFAEGRQVVHTLNASAWAVWELCDGSRTIHDIAGELSAVVGRPAGELVSDVETTVRRLGALGLVDAG
jgi:hypothetical protein